MTVQQAACRAALRTALVTRRQTGWRAGLVWMAMAVCSGLVLAQTAEERTELRRDIEAQRAANQSTYAASRAACYQLFTVNNCLIQAKKKHDADQSELRRQEIILNDGERKRKSAAQFQKMDTKLLSGAEQAAIDQRAQRVDEALQRQRTMADKQRQATEKSVPTPRDVPAKTPRAAPTPVLPKQSDSHAPSAADQALATQAYATKQAQAAKHHNEVESKRRERTKPPSAPLPAKGDVSTPLLPQLLTRTPTAVITLPAVPASR